MDKQVQAAIDAMQSKVNKVCVFLESNAYPQAVKNLCLKVLRGECEYASLEGAVAVLDAQAEQNNANAAEGETDSIPDTAPEMPPTHRGDGVVSSTEDLMAAVARDKREGQSNVLQTK